MWTVTQLMGTKEYRDVTQMKHTLFQSYGEFSELASDIRLLQRSLLKGKACTGVEFTRPVEGNVLSHGSPCPRMYPELCTALASGRILGNLLQMNHAA